MRIAVVHDLLRPTYTVKQLLRAIRELGATPVYIPISYVSVEICSDKPFRLRNRVLEVDGVIVRSIGFTIDLDQFIFRISLLKHMEEEGIVVMNPVLPFLTSRNKYLSLVLLRRAGLPVPRTVVTEDLAYAYNVARELGEIVVKPLQGSRGYGAMRISDADLAYNIMRTLLSFHKPIYVQKFVKKPGRDIRVFVVGEEVVAAIYRIAPEGSWKTNIAQGGKAVPCDLTPELRELAIRAVKALGLWYGGVDIAETDEGPVIFEVNGAPDWRGLEAATGVSPAKAIVQYLIEKLRR